MAQRSDAWIYAEMSPDELTQRLNALKSLVEGTTGRKQRRYMAEVAYVEILLERTQQDEWIQLQIDLLLDII